MCGNATSQPSVNSIAGSANVNVTNDGFANSPVINELTLPVFHDSSKVSSTEEKIRGEFNDRALKPCLEDENEVTVMQLRSLMVCNRLQIYLVYKFNPFPLTNTTVRNRVQKFPV